jgi:RES domain
MAEVPDDVAVEAVNEKSLPKNWSTLDPREQGKTRSFGDEWVQQQRSAILSVPSVTAGERNYVLNPAHPYLLRITSSADHIFCGSHLLRITFANPIPFHFDTRLLGPRAQTAASEGMGMRR